MFLDEVNKVLKNSPAFRFKQAREGIFLHLFENWQEATNLPEDLREKLNQDCPLTISAKIVQSKKDRTVKALFVLADGVSIEAVLMRHNGGRNTICLSTQAGCALGCSFCATGKMGWKRNLSSSEIIIQALFFARWLKKQSAKITNVVFMGMGEPFLNYDNFMLAVKILHDPDGLNIGARHISVSTVGLPDGIKKLAREPYQINLAVSLHASTNELRSTIIPVNKKYSLENILSALEYYIDKTNRQIMIEYLLINGLNDSTKDAHNLAKLLSSLPRKLFVVNLITYNKTDDYEPSSTKKIDEFKKVLEACFIRTTRRYGFGQDIDAACGQLAKKAK